MLSAQDVHDKQFRLVRQSTGYDIDEVDAFLDEVEAAIAALTAALEAARAEQADRPAPVAGAEGDAAPAQSAAPVDDEAAGSPTSAARILELAQQTAEQYLAEARRSAESVVAEAEQAARATVDELEAQRSDLEARVAALRSFEAQIRSRLTGYFEGQLRDLRSLESVPDSAPPG